MEKRIIRSGAPYVTAGAGVLLEAVVLGMGSLPGYLLAATMGAAGFVLGRRLFPDRVVMVETKPKTGDAQVDALIVEARAQLSEIRAANDAIAESQLSDQIDDIETTCREILRRLEEQPAHLSRLRTFLRYYLPTTLQLLKSRAALEGEVNAGRNAEIAQRVRSAMAQVQSALHSQLDALNESRFVNLEADMDALSDMLRSDGLLDTEAAPAPTETAQDDPFSGLFSEGGH